jgi:adenosine kinase
MMALSAPFIPLVFKDALDQAAPFWDYIVGNESEAKAWAEAHDLDDCLSHSVVVPY